MLKPLSLVKGAFVVGAREGLGLGLRFMEVLRGCKAVFEWGPSEPDALTQKSDHDLGNYTVA